MKLGIYGAGGLGREVLMLARAINQCTSRWSEIFFIDDVTDAQEVYGAAVVRFDARPAECEVAIAIGEPALRQRLAQKLSGVAPLATLIHPNVDVPSQSEIRPGAILCDGALISCGVTIGENVLIQPRACVGHDCAIGAYSVVSSLVALAGHCEVGERVFIGMNSCVKEQTRIGDDAIVGMGSAVFSDVADATIVLGNPARAMRQNTQGKVFK
ncbi:acetyltransferase [Cronobacter turicensis]|jgi:sugar O-acyltransferase (sialic acid O-acetyltransferase NeuD family)|uniref:acetyltransferase n=1 Tax=Cronobacter turicensis TaxID=413502 RepID=UPI0015880EEE|nr:acetyltransferase [Cronobacter turicensis]EKM0364860.1 acetyltransferase [Cronobacter turicensis]EKY3199792.1 acetyltransferase [Cronobacter turicensis]EKY3210368.1 acetyltransferase [Cronobacter turicensis]EKY3214050.1 acetyltransferase [Cronobacter turicensis]ELQ6104882.1 acetyltransferase [Cronobacter turicensis]